MTIDVRIRTTWGLVVGLVVADLPGCASGADSQRIDLDTDHGSTAEAEDSDAPPGRGDDRSVDGSTSSDGPTDSGGEDTDDGGDFGGSGTDGTDSQPEPPECVRDHDCAAATPYCDGSRCVDCTGFVGSTCADKDAAAPACRPDDGICVECTAGNDAACADLTPVCDENVCRPCREHAECDVACNLDMGACIDTMPLHVDNSTCDVGGADGTLIRPFCNIGLAIASIPFRGTGAVVVHATSQPHEHFAVEGNRVVAVLGDGPTAAVEGDGGPAVDILGESRLFVASLQILGATATYGIRCAEGALWLDDSQVAGIGGDGIAVGHCSAQVRRSDIRESGGRGIVVHDGGSLVLEDVSSVGSWDFGLYVHGGTVAASRTRFSDNTTGGVYVSADSRLTLETGVIAENGAGWATAPGLQVSGGNATLSYVTLVGSSKNDDRNLVRCENASVQIRNSILVAEDRETVDCPGIDVVRSAVQDLDIVSGNVDVGSWKADWFVDWAGGDVRLGTSRGDFLGIARWAAGDPAFDIDGDPRPTTEGAKDWPGADVPR